MNIHLTILDWWIIGGFFALTILIGIVVAKVASKSQEEFFLGGRNMPWWLLGFSMVATTFSTDTPNLETDFVRRYGVFGNWSWWCMLPTGMLTVFLYAKLWRRSGTVTDLEFYELRYSGRAAAFLRGFRAVYLGLLFNVLIMASVSMAAIKIGGAMLNLAPWQSVLFAMTATVLFSSIGGFRGVLITDFVLFILSMVGAFGAAYFALKQPEVGGLSGLLEKMTASAEDARRLEAFGYSGADALITLFIVPFAITWWSIWYPGAEPGGGGYLVQRMLAAKNENHAVAASLFFNVAHYALRPWPWILVALASLVVFPDLNAIRAALGGTLPEHQVSHDVAYSLMLTRLPAGWIGLVLASLIAAYMSTISTHLNWGASYLVNDVWKRFYRPQASARELVWMGRLFTVLLMVIAGVVALQLSSAVDNFQLILSIGAGTGLLFMLRWFWWRINASCEIMAMVASFIFAGLFRCWQSCPLSDWQQTAAAVGLTTLCWLPMAWLGPQTDRRVLWKFCARINPGGSGWKRIFREAAAAGEPVRPEHPAQSIPAGILAAVFSCVAVYSILLGTGEFIYLRWGQGCLFLAVALLAAAICWRCWKKMNRV